jgi:CheY-like chemotaxis protein
MAITLLVVDDSRVEQVLIESLLRKNPAYRVQLAGNGQEALAGLDQNPFNCRRVRRTGDPMSLETAPPTWGMRARDR